MTIIATEKARSIGNKAGKNAAYWAIQDLWGGRSTRGERETAQSVITQLEEGDSRIYDAFSLPTLSGEWADEMNQDDLFRICTGTDYDPEEDDHQETMDELSTTWEDAVSSSFYETLEESARSYITE
jgi:hypothetical protein